MRWITLMDTRIDGTGLACLESLDRLQTLQLEGPLATVEGLRHLKGLISLCLSQTCLTDGRLEFLLDLPDLQNLHLIDDTVGFPGLAVVRRLPRLKQLTASGAKGSELDIEEFQRANPSIRVFRPFGCGNGVVRRAAELEGRRLQRQGLTGRLRLA